MLQTPPYYQTTVDSVSETASGSPSYVLWLRTDLRLSRSVLTALAIPGRCGTDAGLPVQYGAHPECQRCHDIGRRRAERSGVARRSGSIGGFYGMGHPARGHFFFFF